MKVKIKSRLGRLTVDIPKAWAELLYKRAIEEAREAIAVEDCVMAEMEKPQPVMLVEKATEAPAPAVGTRNSRKERLFGAKEAWNSAAENSTKPERRDYNAEGYKGFLYIRCEKCGNEHGFCVKSDLTRSICECGHHTILHDLLPVFVHCKCGRDFKYKTNIRGSSFTINCLGCGAPVDMALNASGTAYVPFERIRR